MRNTMKATLLASALALGALSAPAHAFQRTDAAPHAGAAVQLADSRDGGRDWRKDRRDTRQDWREERRERIKERREDRREARKEWREERRERLQDRREAQRDWRHDHDDWRNDWRSDWRSDWRNDWRNDGRDNRRSRWERHPRYGSWVGQRLPAMRGVTTLSAWRRYDLPAPPAGHFYVRASDDVYLVHRATHRIVEMFLLR